MHHTPKVLFICKRRGVYGYQGGYSSGLLNSARFISDMLTRELGIPSKVVDVTDNNDIDREVTQYLPTHVVIEALWVVPEKFEVLRKLHPHVKWVVRIHSEIPFLSQEGVSMQWLYGYKTQRNVAIAANSERAADDLGQELGDVLYLPNYYPVDFFNHNKPPRHSPFLNIGCFGAIRPFKNQLAQAFAAITFANQIGESLHFHINAERIEGWNAESILRNIRQLFAHHPQHTLIEHPWLAHKDFLELVSTMHLGMQVSYTETFNIATADLVNYNIPVVVSDEVRWVSPFFVADVNSIPSMVNKLSTAWMVGKLGLQFVNKIALDNFGQRSVVLWDRYLRGV
jgi:hypothetical protein